MTPAEQAARVLADVQIQYFDTKQADTPSGRLLPEQWMPASEVVAAIARHLAPGDDWDAQDAAWCERVAAITADNATLRARLARMEGALQRIADGNPTIDSPEADAANSATIATAALTDGGKHE